MRRIPLPCASLLLLGGLFLVVQTAGQAASSGVQELRIQKVGDVTYFHVRLEVPREMVPERDRPRDLGGLVSATPALAPRLLAPDDQLRLVCQRTERPGFFRDRFGTPPGPVAGGVVKNSETKEAAPRPPRRPVPVEGLEFVGRTLSTGKVKAKLLYPVPARRLPLLRRLARRTPPPVWKERAIVLDFATAKEVPVPAEAAERKEKPRPGREEFRPPVRDDLEGLWAIAQVNQFLALDNEVREFGFYGFAATATARKFGVRDPNVQPVRVWNRVQGTWGPRGRFFDRELYETTTGAAAIAESLQLRRMNAIGPRSAEEKRTIPISKVRGIDIAEHPWKEMIGEKKPVPEPAARLVPHDNYYLHFKRIARFLEFSDLLDVWGTNLTRAYETTSRDHRLKQRYQQQLCLRSTALGKTLGPLVIRGVTLTGNDAYLREGSDLAIIFEVVNRKVFLSAVEPFLAEARKKFGEQLRQSKDAYHGVPIESFVTPLREVSLHRANLDGFVVYANSPVGLRRILDAYQGRSKRLAESLDFQYMRTVFRTDDKEEDGFAFLSDAFIRNLVGPASKIKERRRLEALVSLYMLTHGALYTAWETGRSPLSNPNLLNVTGLKREELPVPEGKPAFWDTENLVARSDAYNTIHFATPLVELPLEQVTTTEAAEYERFRQEYLGLWRQYFDPIGMRVSLRDGKVRLDTYILPLIENSSYNQLRRITGGKSVRYDPASLSAKTLLQYVLRLSDDVNDRGAWLGGPGRGGESLPMMLAWSALDPVGDWFLFRLDDGPAYEKLYRLSERAERGEPTSIGETAKVVWTLPVAIGVDMRNPMTFAATLAALRSSVMLSLPGAVTWAPLEKKYKGVSIVRIQATPAGRDRLRSLLGEPRRKDGFLPAFYYATIDGGFYLTLNEEMMRSLIDGAEARKGKGVEVATSLYVAPKAAEHTRGLFRRLLEQQTHQQARTALPIWHALYRSGIIAPDATPEQARATAYRYLAFVPVSPDGTVYKYDRNYHEVVNDRHGSLRRPRLRATTADDSPLNFLLDQLRSVRADLRFREDGIHTVLTLERGKGGK
jgi:hypothetical protein